LIVVPLTAVMSIEGNLMIPGNTPTRRGAGRTGAWVEALAQHLGAACHLPDLVLTASGLLLGLVEGGLGPDGCALVDLEALDDRLDASEDRKVLALVTQPCQAGVEVLQVDEKALLGDGGAGHGVCSFRGAQVDPANPLMPGLFRSAGAAPRGP